MHVLDAGLLDKAVALTPSSVLRLLAGVDRHGPGGRPVVRLHLVGGQRVEGRLVRVGEDRGHDVVLVAGGDRTDAVGPCMRYVLLDQVVAVDVDDPVAYRDLLTGGAVPAPAVGDEPPPSRLSLRREFAPSAELPVRVAWDTVPGTAEATTNLARLLTALREVVAEVRADELGRQAWAAVETVLVEHRAGEVLGVRRLSEGLELVADLSAALPRPLVGDLGQQMNALL